MDWTQLIGTIGGAAACSQEISTYFSGRIEKRVRKIIKEDRPLENKLITIVSKVGLERLKSLMREEDALKLVDKLAVLVKNYTDNERSR